MSETITVHQEPLSVDTPFGKALCLAWYDYGFWTETQWKCVIQDGGHIVFVPHQDIRLTHQYSARLNSSKPPEKPTYMAKVGKIDQGILND
jgi:hypothetical protein